MLTWPSKAGDWKDQCNIIGINLLMFGNADGPGETPRTQTLAKSGRQTIACVGKHSAKPDTCRDQPIDLVKRDLRLGAGYAQ